MHYLFLISLFSSFIFATPTDYSTHIHWHKLLHYKKNLFGYESMADGQEFFLSPQGKKSPRLELEANLSQMNMGGKINNQHAVCRFPARYLWFQKMGLIKTKYSLDDCEYFKAYKDKINIDGLSLVFTSYYLNSPASAFGHSFLRLKKKMPAHLNSEQTDLLDYGVNYAAMVDTKNALVYAFKGLTGMFKGVFTSLPYYYKIREYNDFESRDIWEYELDLNSSQLDFLIAHLWELSHTYFDYYYFTENCSYHLLGVLEAVNPEWNLTGKLPFYVIPVDTIKAVEQTSGLVRNRWYRPAVLTKLNARTSGLKREDIKKIQLIAKDPKKNIKIIEQDTTVKKAQLLDRAMEAMDFYFAEDLLLNKGKKADEKYFLQLSRAENEIISQEELLRPEHKNWPDQTHTSRRSSFAWTQRNNDFQGMVLRHRFALHDLLDPLAGQPPYSEITFGDVGLRLENSNKVSVNHFDLFKVSNFQPINPWESNLSWSVRLGSQMELDEIQNNGAGTYANSLDLMTGYSFSLLKKNQSFLSIAGRFKQDYFHNGLNQWRFSFGPSTLLRLNMSEKLTLLFSQTPFWRYYFEKKHRQLFSWNREVEIRYHLNKIWSFYLKSEWADIEKTQNYTQGGFHVFY